VTFLRLITMVLTLMLPVICEGATELVKNGSFEVDTDGDGIADFWQYCPGGSPDRLDVKLSRERGRKGGWCQRVTCTGYEGGHVMLAQVGQVAVEGGKWYRLSFYVKGEGMERGIIYAALRDTKDWTDLSAQFTVTVTEEWQRRSFAFRATRTCHETTRLQFWFSGTGTFYLDDVSLTETEALRRFNVHRWDGEKNLVPNGSFEAGSFGWGTYELGGLFGEIDSTTAAHGTQSFKMLLAPETLPVENFDYYETIHQPVRVLSLTTIGWLEMGDAESVTISAYLKSDVPDFPADIGLVQLPGGRVSRKVALTREWKRYSLTVDVKGKYCIPLITVGVVPALARSVTVWIDAVQIERGDKPTAYQPRVPVELGVSSGVTGNFFSLGESVAFDLCLANQDEKEHEVSLAVRATDYWDRKVFEKRLALAVPAGGVAKKRLDTGLKRKGFYRVYFEYEIDGRKVSRNVRAAVIEDCNDADSFFGTNHAYKWRLFLELAKRIGIRWVRDWSLKWDHVEPEKGKFTFEAADIQINRPLGLGFKVLGLLPFPSSNWSSTATAADWEKHKDYLKRARHRWRTAFMPRDIGEFENYVRTTVSHCKDRIKRWEIFNESLFTTYSLPARCGYTPRDYAVLLKAAYRAAKQADPSCKVIGGLSGPPGRLYDDYKGVFEEGGLDYCDAVSIHLYPRGAPPETFERDMIRFNELMRSYSRDGRAKPLWLTEYAYYCDDDVDPITFKWPPDVVESERQCADYTVRYDIMMLANGVEKIFYHIWTTKLNHENASRIFFEYGGYPRKIAAAQAALAAILPWGSRFVRSLDIGTERRVYIFDTPKGAVAAVWSLNRERMTLREAGFAVLDILGNEISERSFSIFSSPVYILAGGRSIDELSRAIREASISASD